MENLIKLNYRLSEEKASLLYRFKNLQSTADLSSTTLMERLASRETKIEEQRQILDDYKTQINELNDNIAFMKSEKEAMSAQFKTDTKLTEYNTQIKEIVNLESNLDRGISSIRLLSCCINDSQLGSNPFE